MIEEYYGFSAAPFSLSPDARFFYDSPGHRQALAYLRFGLQQGEGFIVITGEIGAGKSTLINRLLDELDRNTIEVAYITTSNVNPDDVLRLIASQFNINPATPDKATLLRSLEGYLTRQRRLGSLHRCGIGLPSVAARGRLGGFARVASADSRSRIRGLLPSLPWPRGPPLGNLDSLLLVRHCR